MRTGEFSKTFGKTPRNRIIEFFLEMRELDFAVGDVAKEIKLNRATMYINIRELYKEGIIIKTRKISGGQMYGLNMTNKKVKVMLKCFFNVLDSIVEEKKNGHRNSA